MNTSQVNPNGRYLPGPAVNALDEDGILRSQKVLELGVIWQILSYPRN